MKTSSIVVACFALTLVSSQAQIASINSAATTKTPMPTLSEYRVVDRGANQKVWQRETYETGPNGQVVTNVHRYTELAAGLNYKDAQGQWQDAKEEIIILPDGTAAATDGQHQAYFPGNIYSGVIELVTPNGQHLKSRPLGLSYDDGTNAMMIAELTNSIGYVVGTNQVIYPNAFTGFKADLRYTYTKAGFEQDVILRQQPPTPESLGLNPDTAKLQVLTEFFNPPQPARQFRKLPEQAGLALDDESLGFGQMQMIQGRAFLLGQKAKAAGAMVAKQWVQLDGRQFLVEEVPVDAIVDDLAALPLTAMNSGSGKATQLASKKLVLPKQRLAKNDTTQVMMLAKTDAAALGLVLDYQTVSGTLTGYTFKGDTTYYISGSVSLNGTNIFEGGTVIKYAANTSISISYYSPLIFKTSAYLPAVFTAIDDDTVGEIIYGSTGNPTNYYANPALRFSSSPGNLSNFRISYASQAFDLGYASATISHCQLINCLQGVYYYSYPETLQNMLFANVVTSFNFGSSGGGPVIDIQNTTISGSSNLLYSFGSGGGTIVMTNCILANVANINFGASSFSGNRNGFYNSPIFGTGSKVSSTYPFQTVGAGRYYLTNGCIFRDAGTTNIAPTLLARLSQKTTYPPIVYSNTTISVATTFSPQAQRDTDTPDFGYHYDPIDYVVNGTVSNNATLTLTNGVVVAGFGDHCLNLLNSSQITSQGDPVHRNYLIYYNSVQEQPQAWGSSLNSLVWFGGSSPNINMRFTDGALLQHNAYYFNGSSSPASVNLTDGEWFSGQMSGTPSGTIVLKNNLFNRVGMVAGYSGSSGYNSYNISQNLFYGGSITFYSPSSAFVVSNNAFDGATITGLASPVIFNQNAFINSSYGNTNNGNLMLAKFVYASGALGDFYQASTNLVNIGSTNADALGLYHYTTQTNQVKETNSIVDIGYHYVATDAYGNPYDTDGDVTADYLEDANGNGAFDAGDLSNWLIGAFNGLSGANGLQVFTPLK